MLGVYIHIPFCERKCNYCAFSSFVENENEQEKYIKALISDINAFEGQREVDSIYIGGGTPSVLETEHIKNILRALKNKFEISKNCEITIECNPNSLTIAKLNAYKEYGINRISIGIQSLEENQLKFIGRLHNKQEALSAVKNATSIFENVSCDVLIGLNGMTNDKLLATLNQLVSLNVKHISTYLLQIEAGTPLEKFVKQHPNYLPDDDECAAAYEKVRQYLKSKGFIQYEVSNFAIKGFESKHNFKYWRSEPYIGFGLSAHSYISDNRFAQASNFLDYYNHKLAFCEKITPDKKIEEHLMLGLRCSEGISKTKLVLLGYDITKNRYLKALIANKVVIEEGDKIHLNPDFYSVNNLVITQLLPEI